MYNGAFNAIIFHVKRDSGYCLFVFYDLNSQDLSAGR